ncbi:Polypeptide-transport-associated domain protein FtsQ-type [[Leptolyngbya] sp. PCC 7376]|uniref:cell division protein FtsQ/DivIB n=1 Tax=[Leptolyngbya] sp. PCC 7376 TaxID=111781 RepID=UPI00029EF6D0|nr:FtsQ-type POTRA domain-containing protein [[Leptolyngbya] sp. PCC 7376]AFY37015.1 Polypeptide-transport-associated domain protein FtsQ-type [[Leptolyngbya] sp. PCC 7376]
MPDTVSVIRDDLRKRRKQKQRQRSIRWVQGLWRSFALIGIASGAVWLTTRPEWVLYSSEQIEIEGNTSLSVSTVRELIPLDYPQSLLSLKPQRLEQEIETEGPIAEAIVTRHLLPPSLSVQVQERLPVARSVAPISPQTKGNASQQGYLDEQGNWLPETAYREVTDEITLPTLEVIGIRAIQIEQWEQSYPVLQRSPVKIFSVDWQDSNNLKLNTANGQFHLGSDLAQLEEQLVAIAKLATLDEKIIPNNIDYVDLSDPNQPIIKARIASKEAP